MSHANGPRVPAEFWRSSALALFSAMLTGFGTWLIFGKDSVSRPEMEKYVQENSPWARDRGHVIEASAAQRALSVETTAKLQSVIVAQARAETKLDAMRDDLNDMKKRLAMLKGGITNGGDDNDCVGLFPSD